jgi:NAD(P)-dependent dehydrogenase (short-subunit alcohol dehydrogenase family)
MRQAKGMKGKIAVITGGQKGIGLAIAKRLRSLGATVYATSRSKEPKLEVTSEESVKDLFTAIRKKHGRLDFLVNNAGTGVFAPIEQISADDWINVLATNLTGAFLCTKAAMPLLRRARDPRIINIGSIADHRAIPMNSAYAASKFGLRGLSLSLSEELKETKVRVTLLSPGAVYTEIWAGREGFRRSDMLAPAGIAEIVVEILAKPNDVRIDEVKVYPPKGLL